jgi:hypothetical protein
MMKQRNVLLSLTALLLAIGLIVSTPRLFAQGGILQPNGSYLSDGDTAATAAEGAVPAEASGLLKAQAAAVEKPATAAVAAPAPDVDPSGAVRGQEMPAVATGDDGLSPEATGLTK